MPCGDAWGDELFEEKGKTGVAGWGWVRGIVSEGNQEQEEGDGGCRADEAPTAEHVIVSANSFLVEDDRPEPTERKYLRTTGYRIHGRRAPQRISILRRNPILNDAAEVKNAQERRARRCLSPPVPSGTPMW